MSRDKAKRREQHRKYMVIYRLRERARNIGRVRTPLEWLRIALYRTTWSAKKRGWEFSISEADFPVIPERCPYFPDVVLDYQLKTGAGPNNNSPTIDRIDSTKGYVPGNVEIISHQANSIKNSGTWEQHFVIATRLRHLVGAAPVLRSVGTYGSASHR